MRESEKVSDALADAWFVTVQEALAGDYSLEREIGRGGMGIVYLAREVALDRLVALKVMPPELAERPALRDRFLTEARTAARLSHPNIVPIHRVGVAKQVVFFAMAFIDGETLGARLRKKGVLPGDEVTRIVKETAWALSYAHRQGVVHRDVKPENILLEARTGRVVVADFGIAQVSESDASARAADDSNRHVSGTAQYMSPEQATGEPVDGRSDLYALGVMAYLCVSGRLPFDHENPAAVLAQHVRAPVPAIARTDVPVALSRVITRCLAKTPDGRFANGEALVDALDAGHAARRQLPPALIRWVETRDPFVPLYLLWDMAFVASLIRAIVLSRSHVDGLHLGMNVFRDVGLALLPWAASLGFHMVRTWRMLRVGYSIADLRDAIRFVDDGEREVSVMDAAWSDKPAARALKYASFGAFGVIAATFILPLTMQLLGVREWWLKSLLFSQAPTILLSASAVIWAATAYGVALPGKSFVRKLRGLRDSLWLGPIGARVSGWLSRIAPSDNVNVPAIDRPTEVALELAAQKMFDALPTVMRESMAEFPHVLDELGKVATRARERQQSLLAAQSQSADADSTISNALVKAEAELTEAVQAMERLRLGVMRLYAKADSPHHQTLLQTELHAVTAQLQRLNSAELQIDRLLGPIADTDSALKPARRKARRWWQFGVSTPTPTH